MNIEEAVENLEPFLELAHAILNPTNIKAIKTLTEFAKSMQWQPINKDTPKDKRILVLYEKDAKTKIVKIAKWNTSSYAGSFTTDYVLGAHDVFCDYLWSGSILGWMPLPQLSKDENK